MRKKRLSTALFKNYFILFILVSILPIIPLIIAALLLTDNKSDAEKMMKDSFQEIDVTKVEQSGGWVEVIGPDFKVLRATKKAPHKVGHQLSSKAYHALLTSSNEDVDFTSTAFNKKKEFLLVVTKPYKEVILTVDGVVFLLSLLVYILCFSGVVYLYARKTSKLFTTPLDKLMGGVKELQQGNYASRMDEKLGYEFEELKDAFNVMAQAIEQEREKKEKAEGMRRELAAETSHDLKNPLSSILGYTSYVKNNSQLSVEDRVKYLSIIEKNADRASVLIQDLFELSTLESLDYEMSLKEQDICEFLRQLVALYIPKFEETGIRYHFQIPEKMIQIPFHQEKLDRAISNLITNGLRYLPSKSHMMIILREEAESVQIIVQDDGPGIPRKCAERIFESFVTGQDIGSKQTGTGLGLTITKKIIEKHGGIIHLNTDINEGCQFIMTLSKGSVLLTKK